MRLQSEVNAALKYRVFDEDKQPGVVEPAPAKRQRKSANNQGALALGEEQSK